MPSTSIQGIDDREREYVFEKKRVALRTGTLDDGTKETV
jgi:hypothetical protein